MELLKAIHRAQHVQRNFDLIITAHNYNDLIETLIMKDEVGADWVSFLGIRD